MKRTSVILGAITLLALTGCTDITADEPGAIEETIAPSEASETAESWGEPASIEHLDDNFTIQGFTLPENVDEAAAVDDPEKPALLESADNIKFSFYLLHGQDVERYVSDAWISKEESGKDRGPTITCERKEDASPFWCETEFADPDYDSGTYYGVFVTEPENTPGAVAKKIIVPIYTYTESAK